MAVVGLFAQPSQSRIIRDEVLHCPLFQPAWCDWGAGGGDWEVARVRVFDLAPSVYSADFEQGEM